MLFGGKIEPGDASAPHPLDRRDVQEFLTYGFFPSEGLGDDPLQLIGEWSRRPRPAEDERTVDELVAEGTAALLQAVERCAEEGRGGGRQVVLLSGGLDSRTLLACLLRLFDRSEILAATFGQPGEDDYEFARKVADVAGVEHLRLPTFAAKWSTSGLVDSVLARRVPTPFPFGQRYLSYTIHHELGPEHDFWDGLGGDAVGGDEAPAEDAIVSWDEVIDTWLGNHLLHSWHRLTGSDVEAESAFDPRSVLPDGPLLSADLLSYPDQLDFATEQPHWTARRRMRGYSIHTPFLRGPWLDFMFGVRPRYRYHQSLYLEILRRLDPILFGQPLTKLDGGSLESSKAVRLLYRGRSLVRRGFDRYGLPGPSAPPSGANKAIRSAFGHPGPMQEIAVENLADLAGRGVVPWLDPPSFLRDEPVDHLSVTRLVDLELNLKAMDALTRGRGETEQAADADPTGP